MSRPPVQESYPLSPMQQGMLFHALYAPRSGIDIEQVIVDIEEDIDGSTLGEAWMSALTRHPILRTRFLWENLQQPVQEVAKDARVPIHEENFDGLSEKEVEQRLEDFLDADRRRGFDLTRPPLMRVRLFRIGRDRSRLVWTFHHLLLDARSIPIILNEVFSSCGASANGEVPKQVSVHPYRDYIEWLKNRDSKSDESFWQDLLRGFTAPTPLPASKGNADVFNPAFEAGEQAIQLSASDTSHLRELASQHALTLNTFVQGAWAMLLSRYSGEEDVVFGATRSCRHFAEDAAERVGLFINTLPVRVRVSWEMELIPWLRQVRQQSLAVRPHEHAPLMEVQRWSGVRPGLRLFESLLDFQNKSLHGALTACDTAWKKRKVRIAEKTNFPFTISATAESGLTLEIVHDRNCFEAGAVRRLLGQFTTLLAGMAAQPAARLFELPWLTKTEWQQIREWNPPSQPPRDSKLVHQFFEAEAAKNPDAEAVVYSDEKTSQKLTYGELNERANQLARYLQRLGAGPDTLVGIFIDRCVEMIVGILGILKAGAAYVPIDRFYPEERLAFMIENSNIPILLTKEHLARALPKNRARRVDLDTGWAEIAKENSSVPACAAGPENLAYLIFTSGSTGTPKGVMTTHANLANAYRAWEQVYDLDSVRAHLQMASFSFDVFSGDMVRALCSGGKLVICPHDDLLNPKKLYALMRRENVDFAEFVPLVLRNLIQHLQETGESLDFMRLLIAGSDSWYVKEYSEYKHLCGPNTRLINSYGITETTIDSTYFEGRLDGFSGEGLVPIGRPFANSQVHILDAWQRPVPVGVPGEIYIGGAGVTRGYLRQPELTAEKFIPDPFQAGQNPRLYRTGDSGRYLEDGNIELLGRIDQQVKVRGFRIELGEVEGALQKFDGIAECAVTAQEMGAGEKRLIAYLVAAPHASIDLKKLRNHLKDKLAFFAIPSAFVMLNALPMTPNGKVDRRALPAPRPSDLELGGDGYTSPRNNIESRLVEIWKEILGLERIGIHDNFLELGGHSMLAVRLFAQIKRVFNKDLPLTALFQALTIEQLAILLQQEPADWSCIVQLQPGGPKPPLFWMHTLGGGGSGGMFRYQIIGRHLTDERASYGIRAPAEPFTRMEEMAAHYLQELRQIQPQGPYYLGGYCFGGNLAFEMAQQLLLNGEKVAFLGMIESSPYYGDHGKITWTPSTVFHIFRNLFYWIGDFFEQSPEEYGNWLQRKFTKLKRIVVHKRTDLAKADLTDFLEAADASPEYRKYVEAHWEALTHYEPKPYPGRIALFRVRKQAIMSFDPTLWWGELAIGGVDVRMIPGTHETIFDGPHVRPLAHEIQSCLDALSGGTSTG